jgi:hypothetical protein
VSPRIHVPVASTISNGPTVNTAVKTAVFKLHNPSRRKRAMLDHALQHNHLGYSKALKTLAPLLRSLVAGELHSRSSEKDLSAQERGSVARQRKWKRQSLLVKK